MKIIKFPSCFLLTIFLFINLQCDLEGLEGEKNSKEELLGKEITDWDARLEYARLLSNMHRYDESLVQLEKLLKDKPDAPAVQIEIAKVLYYQGKFKEALQLLEKIPSQDSNDHTKLLTGDIYLALKEYSKAEVIYNEWLKKSPKDDLVKFKLAEMLSWQKRYDESIQLFQEILTAKPDDIQIRRKYAMVLMWMGEEDEAAKELEKTLY